MSIRYKYQPVGYMSYPDPPDYGCDYFEECKECEHYDYRKKCAEGYYDN